MDKKNILIILLGAALVFTIGLFLYNTNKQQKLYENTLKRMEYNMSRSNGKGRQKDPYKEIAVNNTLRKKVREVQECYNNFVSNKPEKTDGFVEIDWIILPDGNVKKSELISSNLGSDVLNNCILNIIRTIEFPPPPTGNETYMTYKYHFKKAEDKKTEEKK